MKSFLVVNQRNDPFYIDHDTQFAEYIFRRAKDGGFIEENTECTELDANLVMQLFSPLVLSQWLLIDQTKEPCSSILCPDGFCFAFRHTDDLLFIAVNGDGTESEAFLHRKTQAFIMIMRFIFGPVNEELSQTHAHSRKGKWNFLRQLMQNWSDMVDSEQAFLVEAIERLHVNQMVNEKCMEILLKSVKQFQTSKDLPTHHAMLLVNSKLLALYSNRSANELRPKDLLMTIILSKTMYPQTDRLEDLFSKFYSNTRAQAVLTTDDNSDPGDDEYHSVPNTPRDHRSQSPASSEKSATEKTGATQDPDSQFEKSFEKITLLDLFKEKCSDDNLTKQSLSEDFPSVCDELEESKEHSIKTNKRYSKTFCVEAIVHHPASTTTEHPQPVPQSEEPFYNSSPPTRSQACADGSDKIWSEFENQEECSPTSVTEASCTASQDSDQVQVSDHIKHEKSETEKIDKSLPIKSTVLELKEEANIEVAKSKHSVGGSNVQPSPESSEKEMFENRDNSVLAKKYADSDSMRQTEEHNIQSQAREINSSIVSVPDSDLKPTSSDLHDDTSLQSLVAASNKSHSLMDTRSLSSRDSSATELNSKSRNSTPSQHSGEADVPSRTSSVISNLSKSYPELLAQSGRDLSSIYSISSPLDDLSCEITRSRRITAAVGNLQSDTSTVTVTESSSVTVETANSTFSSSTGSLYLPQTIFLETSTCLYSPYNLHTTQIFPGVTLLMLSQAPRYALADSLYQVIQTIKDLVYGRRSKLPRNRSIYVYEAISAQLGKIHNGLKKLEGRAQNISSDVYARWEKEDLKHKLLDFLERDTTYLIPPDLESPVMELYKKLRELFSLLYLMPIAYTAQIWETLAQINDRIKIELSDYREYLNVKAQRNITMTSYIDEFPGLVHFIFIDRHFHQMTAPSLNISLKEGERMDATSYLKEKIWSMYQHMMSKLSDGYTTVMMRDGDFYFSYFLWFEDSAGNPLPVQESYKPARKQPYPGILCGSFYRDLVHACFPHSIQGSVHCFEMFLMHLGTVHPMYIAAQCRKLAYKMWEMSGEIHFSVNLL